MMILPLALRRDRRHPRRIGGAVCLLTALVFATAWMPMAIPLVLGDTPDGVGEVGGLGPPAGIADLKAIERQVLAALDNVTASVVSVSGGSGVVISQDGYVLTVAHVGVRAGRNVTVTFPDGRRAKATTLGNDRGVDAGLVKISGDGPWPYAEMGRSAGLQPGQWCLALGYPVTFERGKPPVVRIGRVLRHDATAVIADAAIMGGDSGGPLFDLDGKVIAVGSCCDQSLRTNFFVPIDCYRENWDRLAAGEDFNSLAPEATASKP